MFNLIPVSLLISAIGGIIYIVSNHLSEFDSNNEKNEEPSFSFKARFASLIGQLPLDNVKSQSLSLTQKTLHKLRLFLLKSDNRLSKLIGKISQHDKPANGNSDINSNADNFWNDFSEKQCQKKVIMPPKETEAKIDFALKNEAAKKFFDSVKNSNIKEMDIRKPVGFSGASKKIELAKISTGINIKPVKKTLKNKKVKNK